MERPFTGDDYWRKEVGTYSCKVCSQKLFLTEHKFKADNGYSNFWNHIIEAVDYRPDNLEGHAVASDQAYIKDEYRGRVPETRAVCSNCESHLGFIYDDGPGPFYKRFTINAGSVTFKEKPWFKDPLFSYNEKMLLREYDEHVNYIKDERSAVEYHEEFLVSFCNTYNV